MTPTATQLFIDGEYRDGGDHTRQSLVNPATGDTLCEVARATAADADAAIESAHRAWESGWRDLAPGKRADVLYELSRLIRDNLEDLARLECANIGKPITDARDEIGLGARVFEYYAGAISHFGGQTIPVARGGIDFTLRQSMGVVAAIVPWNFPFPITCWKSAPALAAGNCVVLKPASLSPLTALRLGALAIDAGVPPGVLQILPGPGAEIGDILVKHPRVRKISFTGSTEIGSRIMAMAAPDLKRVSLELGGKSPNIVFADCDIEQAARQSPMSVFANTGQDCCARSRVFVEKSVLDRFVETFVAATRELAVGDPTHETTQIGPMVSHAQRQSVEGFLEDARTGDNEILCGGNRPSGEGFFLNPAVIVNVETGDRIWRDEIFGPAVCIRPFENEHEMLAEVNASPYGLAGSIWTDDLKRALRVARRVESGVLSINSHSSVHVEAPFGGFKQSGIGRDLGMHAMEGYTELKNIYIAD